MKVLHRYDKAQGSAYCIAIFGLGLIGTEIYWSIIQRFFFTEKELPFSWSDRGQCEKEINEIFRYLDEITNDYERKYGVCCARRKISIIWSAGKAGFSAMESEVEKEFNLFKIVLSFAEKVKKRFNEVDVSFHLLSSAGGLFEGKSLVDEKMKPMPYRPYGRLKEKQEASVVALASKMNVTIYRPTSVYGYLGIGYRMGLIPTLVKNGLQNNVSKIYGSPHTLRDYIFSRDVGRYIVDQLFSYCDCTPVKYVFLGSGKPSSIFEVREIIEDVLRKRIFVRFMTSEEQNVKDITLHSSIFPEEIVLTDLYNGVRSIKEKIIAAVSGQHNV